MSVEPSEEQGNIPLDSPSEQQTEAVEEQQESQEDSKKDSPETSVELYDLPDGRKVTADELYKEHTENLLPEFTRRSQKLSEYEKQTQTEQPKENPYADPDYIPKSYEEIIAAAEERAMSRLDARERAKVETQQAVESQVASEIDELKKLDPSLNTDKLFAHAVKYGFNNLKVAYNNMKDMADLVEKTQKKTVQDVAKRTDPVSKSQTGSGTKPHPSQFQSAADYLSAIKGSS